MAARRRGRSSSPSTSPSASPPPKKGVSSRNRRSAPSSPSSSSSKSSPSRSESPSPRSKRLQRARELLSRVPPDKEFSKNEKEQERLKTRGKDKENSKNQAQDKASDKGKERDDNRRKPNNDSRDISNKGRDRDDSRGRGRDDSRGKTRDDIRGRARDSDGEKEKVARTIVDKDNHESKTRNDDRMKNRDRIRDDYRGKERVKDDNRYQERVKDDNRNKISERSKGGGKDDTRNKEGDRKRVRTDAKDTDDYDDPRHKKEKSTGEHENRPPRSSSPMDSGRRQNRRLDGENARPRDQEEDASDKDPTRPGDDSLEQMKVAEAALEEKSKSKEKKPSFEYTGKLAAETNKIKGITLQFTEPPEARSPTIRWRLYVFKDGEPLSDPLYIHRQSCYLFGRERRIADIPTDHPSCSKQHAVIQYRLVEKEGEDGMASSKVQPYLMDLNSTNGTSLNGERIEPQRYYELFEKDTVKFGNSSREYVLLHEHSAG